jgi:hypothetical protein
MDLQTGPTNSVADFLLFRSGDVLDSAQGFCTSETPETIEHLLRRSNKSDSIIGDVSHLIVRIIITR